MSNLNCGHCDTEICDDDDTAFFHEPNSEFYCLSCYLILTDKDD